MKFAFVMVGWLGTANNSRVFLKMIQNPDNHFLIPLEGKYYLCHGECYHLCDYRGQQTPKGPNELFNYTHSSLCNVIERCFVVLKAH
ncbi:hypothetical protein D0Y65_009578 [Glycine soja]|uniref:DDE Tnp4 domain-containing protein n=2 Tax=Glycine subgen. Soja TaxID=1462606 RepID=A0A0R0KEX0_SOYBN|nr:hypothetical protein D0Y65_009578 [Glycine soja]